MNTDLSPADMDKLTELVEKKLKAKTPKKKAKPTIKHISFQCDFNKAHDLLGLEFKPAPKPMLESMDITFECKLDNVPMDGGVKYQIMQDIKDAVEKVKEKWS